MSDRPNFEGMSELTEAMAREVYALMIERGCDDFVMVGVTATLMHAALLRLPQVAARKTFSAAMTTMLESLGFEKGRREVL